MRERKVPVKTLAQDIMSSPLVSIQADQPISDALRLARDNGIRRLAVTRNGRLIGIVTEKTLPDVLLQPIVPPFLGIAFLTAFTRFDRSTVGTFVRSEQALLYRKVARIPERPPRGKMINR